MVVDKVVVELLFIQSGRFRLDIRKHFFMKRVVKHPVFVHREVVAT